LKIRESKVLGQGTNPLLHPVVKAILHVFFQSKLSVALQPLDWKLYWCS